VAWTATRLNPAAVMSLTAALISLLQQESLDARDAGDGTLHVSSGQGLRKREAKVDWRSLEAALADVHDEREREADVHSWARGVAAVLTEPRNNKAPVLMEFAEAAKSIMPQVERSTFALGARVAGGEAHTMLFGADLHLAFYIELDDGFRLLSREQVIQWGATDDRIERAAFSILYHRSRHTELSPASQPGVDEWTSGDGFDGARALILDAVDWFRCGAGARFAAPSQHLLLVTADATSPDDGVFTAMVEEHFRSAERPLSRRVFRFVGGRRTV
jgi:hypothetical protein